MKIEGLGAVVTGGASGLGAATARLLADRGAKVTLFDLNAEAGEAMAAEIGGLFSAVDVTNEDSVAAGLDAAEQAHGVGRILVNCAGVAPAIKAVGRDFVPHPIDSFRRAVEINLVGTFLTTSRFAARLQQVDTIGEERGANQGWRFARPTEERGILVPGDSNQSKSVGWRQVVRIPGGIHHLARNQRTSA